jgi:organic hydroperoxide reductase OsmC/OhrA
MRISAQIESSRGEHHVTLSTNEQSHALHIAPRATGSGSSANGGELLFLALATCYCNDIYREAARRGIGVERVEVRVSGEFGAEGEPGRNVIYEAKVWARALEAAIVELMQHTDRVAEVQNTLRAGTPVTLARVEAVAV